MADWWHHFMLFAIIGVWLTVLEYRVKALKKEIESRGKTIGRLMVLADRFWKQ